MSRKGITPVIAVVLLLLITVGAVASAWGLYQEVVSGDGQLEDLQNRQRVQQMSMNVQTVYRNTDASPETINVSLRNTGSVPLNLSDDSSDFNLLVDMDGTSEYLPINLLDSATQTSIENSECFGTPGTVLTTDGENQEISCNTGIEFPEPGETVGFRLQNPNFDTKMFEWSCQPASSSSTLCG